MLMSAASFAEMISLGAIFPFLGSLAAPELISKNQIFSNLIDIFPSSLTRNILVFTSTIFMLAIVVSAALRMLLLFFSTKLSFAAGADLSMQVYARTLHQPYSVHIRRHSSEIINGVSGKANGVIYGALLPLLTCLSSAMIFIAIVVAFIVIDPLIAIGSLCFFGLIYGGLAYLVRKRLLEDSVRIAKETSGVIKILQEGLGGIRDILIDGTQSVYCEFYRNADLILRKSQASNLFISQFPRYLLEGLAMFLLACAAFMFAWEGGDIRAAIPILGVIALAAQRILPILQQGYGAWASIQGSRASLEDTLALLGQPLPDSFLDKNIEAVRFKRSIQLENISFKYEDNGPFVLENINLSIRRGERVGFVGESGCGKSTLIDIIMGLLYPSDGALIVDGVEIDPMNCRSWQLHIAHVPQSIFLTDGSIEENIAFGVPANERDPVAVRRSAEQAKISDLIDGSSEVERVRVGERGARLSGGQRQRIGIARALYKNAEVLIFDEATSALDSETEKEVMESIDSLGEGLTIFIVAHRLSTLSRCSKIVEIANGTIKSIATYDEFMTSFNGELKK